MASTLYIPLQRSMPQGGSEGGWLATRACEGTLLGWACQARFQA